MTMQGNIHDDKLIDQYLDGELPKDELARFDLHMKDCPSCQKSLKQRKIISETFNKEINEATEKTDFARFQNQVMGIIKERNITWRDRVLDFITPKRMLIPATVMAGLLLVVFYTGRLTPTPLPEPSGIVASLSGEASSMMIIKTPNTNHTIIWFNEALDN